MFKEFKEFAVKGNVLDMAIGIIVGAAFGKIVNSLVTDLLMPPLGLMLGSVDFSNIFVVLKPGKTSPPYSSLAEAQTAGAVTINFGVFVNTVISFLIVTLAVFMLVRAVNRLQKKQLAEAPPETTRPCPFCLQTIPLAAKRCPHCTSTLEGAPA